MNRFKLNFFYALFAGCSFLYASPSHALVAVASPDEVHFRNNIYTTPGSAVISYTCIVSVPDKITCSSVSQIKTQDACSIQKEWIALKAQAKQEDRFLRVECSFLGKNTKISIASAPRLQKKVTTGEHRPDAPGTSISKKKTLSPTQIDAPKKSGSSNTAHPLTQ